jgi:hypothetical protein
VPDDPSAAGDELAALRAANAWLEEANALLRQVVEAKDTEIAALRAAMEAGQARQADVIRRLELRVAELERGVGMDSQAMLATTHVRLGCRGPQPSTNGRSCLNRRRRLSACSRGDSHGHS